MKTETIECMQKIKSEVYIAYDGKIFDSYNECWKYEHSMRQKKIERCIMLMKHKVGAPYGCSYIDEEAYEYLWLLPKNKEDIEAINDAFDVGLQESGIGEWICIEYKEDEIEEAYPHLFEDSVNAFRILMDELGYEVIVREKI